MATGQLQVSKLENGLKWCLWDALQDSSTSATSTWLSPCAVFKAAFFQVPGSLLDAQDVLLGSSVSDAICNNKLRVEGTGFEQQRPRHITVCDLGSY
jgi:hypothetical protein